jgi:hypothetical protein
MHRPDNSSPIAIDTLGRLAEHGHGIGGYCRDCRRLFAVSLTVICWSAAETISRSAWRRCGALAATSGARNTALSRRAGRRLGFGGRLQRRLAMTTAHKDKLQLLSDAKKKLESAENLTLDDVVQLCLEQMKEWPRGSTDAARTAIADFLRAVERRARKVISP